MENKLNEYLTQIYSSIDLEFFIKFLIVYFFIIWLSLVVWVLKDIRNRSSNTFLQLLSFLVAVIPFFGIFIYLIIRPSRTLYEKYYEEIEENLDIINEIIEERKKQFEIKIKKSIEEEKVKNLKNKKINYIYKVEILKNETEGLAKNLEFKKRSF